MIVQNIAGRYVALMRAPCGTQGGYLGTGATFAEAIAHAFSNSLKN